MSTGRGLIALTLCLAFAVAACERTASPVPSSPQVAAPPTSTAMTFAGASAGPSIPDHLSCERGGAPYEYFSVRMAGVIGEKSYFMRLNAYPYHGPSSYTLVTRPGLPLDHASVDPLRAGDPGVGYLNFIPKWVRGNAYNANPHERSSLTVEAGEGSGSLVAEMVSEAGRLRVAGTFVCGPPFTI